MTTITPDWDQSEWHARAARHDRVQIRAENVDAAVIAPALAIVPHVLQTLEKFRDAFAVCYWCVNNHRDGHDESCAGDDAAFVLPREFYIAAHAVDLAYGGPEEGGWWFDAGSVVHASCVPRVDGDDGTEKTYAALCAEWLRTELRLRPRYGRSNRSDVRGGPDLNVGVATTFPTDYPAERPHYE